MSIMTLEKFSKKNQKTKNSKNPECNKCDKAVINVSKIHNSEKSLEYN